ncbi:hypothetical protein DZC73_26385 [Albitalea terrae]|uniref:Uncharacterized protein n=1 Tax=Piscinibacter terrae TaxID=2496871 RepID=A0A3N7JKY5_9BURK|nr:hypothetical protein DZC73_26385 [Albitalea terrae]
MRHAQQPIRGRPEVKRRDDTRKVAMSSCCSGNHWQDTPPLVTRRPALYAIGSVAACWTIGRVISILA